jgi:hypothetical protein
MMADVIFMHVPAETIICPMVRARGASVAILPSVVKLRFVVEDATPTKGTATTAGAITARTTQPASTQVPVSHSFAHQNAKMPTVAQH